MTAGIRCPICAGPTGVVETRQHPARIRRRRHCETAGCAGRVTTIELAVNDALRYAHADMVMVPRQLLEYARKIVAKLDSSTVECETACVSPDGDDIPVIE